MLIIKISSTYLYHSTLWTTFLFFEWNIYKFSWMMSVQLIGTYIVYIKNWTKQKLPFLDVDLIRNCDNLTIKTKVYRKEIQSNNTNSTNSSSLSNYKAIAFRFYIKCTFNVCIKQYVDQELIIIRNLTNNSFLLKFIDNLIYQTHYGINNNNKFKYNDYII